MKIWPYLTLSAAIATGFLLQVSGFPANADTPTPMAPNSFAVTTSGQNPIMAWRINTTTGAVSVCFSADPDSPPRCSPWSVE